MQDNIDVFKDMLEHGKISSALTILKQEMARSGLGQYFKTLDEYDTKLSIKKRNTTSKYTVSITDHAIERTTNYVSAKGRKTPDGDLMMSWLTSGDVLEYDDILAYGYRPHPRHAEESVYIQLPHDLIAVLAIDQESENNKIAWVTTYSLDRSPKWVRPISPAKFNEFCKNKSKRRRK